MRFTRLGCPVLLLSLTFFMLACDTSSMSTEDVSEDMCSEVNTAACLYVPATSDDGAQLGRIELQPPHRLGPVLLPASERSVLPVTVWVPTDVSEPFPVVVWSHGGGSRKNPGESAPEWSRAFAEAGYAVLAMHHMARTQRDLEENVCQPLGVSPTECDVAVYTNVYESTDRGQDAISVLDSLDVIGTLFGVRFDPDRIAVAGHSGGTNAALYLAGGIRNVLHSASNGELLFSAADLRPKAFIGLSPPGGESAGWTIPSLGAVNRPLLSATGAGDLQPPLRIELHEQLAPGDKYRLFINSPLATHGVFNMGFGENPNMERQKIFHEWLVSAAIAFLDAHLRDDDDARAWLSSSRIATAIDAEVAPSDAVQSWSVR